MSIPYLAQDLPASAFPFTVEYVRVDTKEVVHTSEVAEPGVLRVPPLRRQIDCAVGVRITFATGDVEEYWP